MSARDLETLRGMTFAQIRRAQGLVKAQIPMAYEQRNTPALRRLQQWDDDYLAELLRRQETRDARRGIAAIPRA